MLTPLITTPFTTLLLSTPQIEDLVIAAQPFEDVISPSVSPRDNRLKLDVEKGKNTSILRVFSLFGKKDETPTVYFPRIYTKKNSNF